MADSPQSSFESSPELCPPPGFQTIQSVFDLGQALIHKPFVDVIGVVRDYQPPISTSGPDWKCTITIVDCSIESASGIKVNFFFPQSQMPQFSSVGDVVILKKIRAQNYQNNISLLKHMSSEITVFHAESIPKWIPNAPVALPRPSFSSKNTIPSNVETTFVIRLSSQLDSSCLPDQMNFEQQAAQAMNVKQKFSLLKDVKEGNFCDLIGQVIRFHDGAGRGSLYLSDYTEHPHFYKHTWGGITQAASRDGDEYGYVRSKPAEANDWPGPFGKYSIQITVYEPHLTYLREEVKPQQWVNLRNVQIKYGREGGLLEGFLRGDQRYTEKINIDPVWIPEDRADRDSVDPQLIEALKRKKAYEKRYKAQREEIMREEAGNGSEKRKLEPEDEKMNGKKRRKLERAKMMRRAAAIDQEPEKEPEDELDLNKNIKAFFEDQPVTSIAQILKKQETIHPETKEKILLPFINTKYKARVRVVDFWPHKLEEFSVGRRVSEYEILSDASDNEDTDREEDMRQYRNGKGYGGRKIWEWRFALQVEEAGQDKGSEKLWLLVDNEAGQMLLNEDATNLCQDKDALIATREKIFTLWGDLEEKKTAFLKTPAGKALLNGGTSVIDDIEPTPPSYQPAPKEVLPPHSDEENDAPAKSRTAKSKSTILTERDPKAGSSQRNSQNEENNSLSKAIWNLDVTNEGFKCCVKQYGVKVDEEDDDEKCDAGEGKRWERMFGLFGTKIDD